MELEALRFVLAATMFGSTPANAGAERGRRIHEEVSDSRELQGWATRVIGTMLALADRVDEGRELLEESRAIFRELGNKQGLAVPRILDRTDGAPSRRPGRRRARGPGGTGARARDG